MGLGWGLNLEFSIHLAGVTCTYEMEGFLHFVSVNSHQLSVDSRCLRSSKSTEREPGF